MIYAAETFSTALLEKLVHLNGVVPAGMHAVEILASEGVSIERFDAHAIPGWVNDEHATKVFGDAWFREGRSLLLRVPSVPAAMVDHNVLINPGHPVFRRLTTKTPSRCIGTSACSHQRADAARSLPAGTIGTSMTADELGGRTPLAQDDGAGTEFGACSDVCRSSDHESADRSARRVQHSCNVLNTRYVQR